MHAVGDYRAALEAYEAAFVAYRDVGDLVAAARAARTIGWFRGWVFGEWAVYQGWTRQAVVLLERAGDERMEGWVRYEEARRWSDLDVQRRLYLETIGLARRAGDADLECDATASLGMMLVFSGLVEEGMAYLDGALAAIRGGGVRELPWSRAACVDSSTPASGPTTSIGPSSGWGRRGGDPAGKPAGRGRLLPSALCGDLDHRRAVG